MGDAREEARRKEPRSMEETKGRNPDLRPRRSDVRTDRRHEMDGRTWAEKRGRISYSRPRESDVRTDWRHERDSRSWAEKRENGNSNIRVNESYHKESYANRPQQQRLRDVQAKIIRDPRHRDPRKRCQDISQRQDWVVDIENKYNKSLSQICDVIVAGIRQDMMERRHRENSERQRREAQENTQQRRQRETSAGQRFFEKERREVQENAQKQRLMVNQTKDISVNHKVDAHGHNNLQGQRQRELQTREARENVQERTQRDIVMGNGVAEESFEEQRLKNLEEQIQRDTEKLKREAEESVEEQRLKANTIPDSQKNERFEEIISQMIDETVEGFKRERMAKAIPEPRGLERFKDISQIHDEIVAGYIQAKMEKRSVNGQENLAEQTNGNIEMQSTEAEESVDEQRR